jgi:hypothetical protein
MHFWFQILWLRDAQPVVLYWRAGSASEESPSLESQNLFFKRIYLLTMPVFRHQEPDSATDLIPDFRELAA